MTHELLLMLQDLRLSAPGFFTDAALMLSSPFLYLVVPIAVGAVLFWCVDKRKGEWVLMNMFSAMFIGHVMKDVIRNPRPWVGDDRIIPEQRALKGASDFSTPSGHSSEATAGFGSLAFVSKNRIIGLLLFALVFAVMFSRLYLGVHTLFDVLTGFLLALTVMAANRYLLYLSYSREGMYNRIAVIYLLSFITLAMIWALNYEDLMWCLVYCAVALGALVGRVLEHNFIGFEERGQSPGTVIFRIVTGSLIAIAAFGIPYVMLGGTAGSAIGGFMASFGIYAVSPLVFNLKSNN